MSTAKSRIRIDSSPDFDEPLWPINLGILVIAAAAAGFVGVTSTFPDPNQLDLGDPAVVQTGWGRLVAVILTALAAVLAVFGLQRWVARRVLFCLLVGLITHLWLGLYLHEQYLEVVSLSPQEQRALLAEDVELTTVPDYDQWHIAPTSEPQSFEKPVEPEPPRESQPLEVEKKAAEHEVVAEQPNPVPQTLPNSPPVPLQMDRAESSVPLLADRVAGIKLSRQTTPDRPEPNEPIPQPAAPKTADAPVPALAAESARTQRRVEQAPAPEPTRRAVDVPTSLLRSQLDRQSQEMVPQLSFSAPQPGPRQAQAPLSEMDPAAMPSVPTTETAALPDRRADQMASSVSRSAPPTGAPAPVAASSATTLATPGALVPQSRRSDALPRPADLALPGHPLTRSALTEPAVSTPVPAVEPSPTTSDQPAGTIQASAASRAARRADRPAATGSGSGGAAGQVAALAHSQASARIGPPKIDTGPRPGLEPGGAGNPLSRSTRALPVTPADLPPADQTASTGTGAAATPDMKLDASVAGPTRRITGTTTDLAIGRVSLDPSSGTMWGEPAPPVPLRRSAPANSTSPSATNGGGGREPLARSAFVADAASASPGDLMPAAPGNDSSAASAGSGSLAGGLPAGGSELLDTASAAGVAPSGMVVADASTVPVRMESLGAGQGQLAQGEPGGGSPAAMAGLAPDAGAAVAPRKGGESQPSENVLAGGASPTMPRRSLGPFGGLSIDMPPQVETPGAGPSRDPVEHPSAGPAGSQTERIQAGPAVPIREAPGSGGLSDIPSPELGIPGRHARPESVVAHSSPGRFLLDRAAGRPPLDASLMKPPAAAFKQRFPGQRNETAQKHGATESSDRAVEQGLYFLARCQFPDGRWALDRLPPGVVEPSLNAGLGEMNSDTAATGLALLAFLGKGYTHVDDKYRNQVGAALRWLVSNQQEDGSLFNNQSDQTLYAQFYAHGIASIALGEAYGMTWDEDLLAPLQRAIGFTLSAQHPQRGGWRYRPQQETDTSVSGWHLMALKSAQMAGLEIPTESLARVSAWLDLAQGQDGSRYRYNPYALDNPSQRQGRVPSLAMTAEGLLMRMYLGRDRGHPEMISGANYLRENFPGQSGTPGDVYYLYYATQVMFQMQGDYWPTWNEKLRPRLESTQVQKGQLIGSWSPIEPTRDRWGHAGGRLYVTAMNLLMLEVYYRHMPLFRELGG